jgi:hypothetical protein
MSFKNMVFVLNSINICYLGENVLQVTHAHTDMKQSQDLLLDRTVMLTGAADDYRTTQTGVQEKRSCHSYGQQNLVLICKICPGLKKTRG